MDILLDTIKSMKHPMKTSRRKARVDLHITLPPDAVLYLDRLAKESGETRNSLVCEAVVAYRAQRTKAELQAAMRADVDRLAEENTKILREFEPHAIEVLLRSTQW